MEDTARPHYRTTIHGHPVYCDEQTVRDYLRKLDADEAQAIFGYAKEHGSTEFEMSHNNSRYNCTMEYDDGAYLVLLEGREGGSGWF